MTADAAATDAVALRPSPHRFTVAEYKAMGAVGILAEDDRVELGDASPTCDRDVKAPLYARAGVPQLWIVDVGGRRVEVCREPTPDGYRSVSVPRPGEAVALLAFPDVTVEVAAILGTSRGDPTGGWPDRGRGGGR